MPSNDPEKRKEYKKRYAERNKEKIQAKNVAKRHERIAAGEYTNPSYAKIKAAYAEAISTGVAVPDFALKFIRDRMWRQAKWRANAYGLKFTISADDIKIPTHCPISGEQLILHTGRGPGKNSPSLDRINNNLGYTPDNIAVISSGANQTKGPHTTAYFERLVAHMKGNKNG